MSRESVNPVPTSYDQWSRLAQSIGRRELNGVIGEGRPLDFMVRRVPFPSNLIGMSALSGTIVRAGSASEGYKIRVRGQFPSLQHADYVIQRTPFNTWQRSDDFWVGVMCAQESPKVWLKTLWPQDDSIPSPQEFGAPGSHYMPLEREELPAVSELLHAAKIAELAKIPKYNSRPDMFAT